MIRIALALSAVLLWLAPALAGADLLCQHKKSRRLLVSPAECPRKYEKVVDLGTIGSATGTPLATVRTGNIASGAVTREKVADGAIDAAKVQDGALGLQDLAFSAVLPYPANATGNHWRVVAADLDLSDAIADGDDVAIDSQLVEPWLELTSIDGSEVSATLRILNGVFSGAPLCVTSLSQAGTPDAAQNLETSVVGGASPTIQVRVVGTDRRFNVRGTLLCLGVAGDA